MRVVSLADTARHLPQHIAGEVGLAAEKLASTEPLAVWLSGSVARERMRPSSDIDWVIVVDSVMPRLPDDWPSARHAFHVFTRGCFMDALASGREFAVWQLAYGRAIALQAVFQDALEHGGIGGCRVAAEKKRRLIGRRQHLTEVFARCGDWSAVCTELLLATHQQARLLLIEHGVVPGCREEVEEQLMAVSPHAAAVWRAKANQQIRRLAREFSRRMVVRAASVARIRVPAHIDAA